MPDERGNYTYMAPSQETSLSNRFLVKDKFTPLPHRGFISFEFSYQMGVIKTRPGFASEIALDIDTHASSIILGTIAGEDTVLLIPREGVTRQDILNMLGMIIPGIKRESEEVKMEI